MSSYEIPEELRARWAAKDRQEPLAESSPKIAEINPMESGGNLFDVVTGFGDRLNATVKSFENPFGSTDAFKRFITFPAGAVSGASALGAAGLGLFTLKNKWGMRFAPLLPP